MYLFNPGKDWFINIHSHMFQVHMYNTLFNNKKESHREKKGSVSGGEVLIERERERGEELVDWRREKRRNVIWFFLEESVKKRTIA